MQKSIKQATMFYAHRKSFIIILLCITSCTSFSFFPKIPALKIRHTLRCESWVVCRKLASRWRHVMTTAWGVATLITSNSVFANLTALNSDTNVCTISQNGCCFESFTAYCCLSVSSFNVYRASRICFMRQSHYFWPVATPTVYTIDMYIYSIYIYGVQSTFSSGLFSSVFSAKQTV